MPRADRGFGRKLLSQLNPRWPITPIGQFALNRSAQPSRSEFYIAGFPGLSIIQTVVDDFTMISGIDHALRTAIPAENVYVIATNAGTSYGAFAHWSHGNLKRAFAAVNEKVYEDLGLVETFESSYWALSHHRNIRPHASIQPHRFGPPCPKLLAWLRHGYLPRHQYSCLRCGWPPRTENHLPAAHRR